MRRNSIFSSLAVLLIAAQPFVGAPALAQNQNQNQNQAAPNQNQVQTQSESQNQNQNQNQNQGNGDEDEDGGFDGPDDGVDNGSTPTLTLDEASSLPDHVCFYADPELKGETFCAEAGGYSLELSNEWDNRISSLEIAGTVKVTVCTDDKYGDTCADYSATMTTLPADLDDAISSWKAE